MKTLIFRTVAVFTFFLLATPLWSQFLKEDTVFLNKVILDNNKQSFDIPVQFTNPTKYTSYFWKRSVKKLASNWETAVCDPNSCKGAEVDSSVFFVDSGYSDLIWVYFYVPHTSFGEGAVELTIRNDSTKEEDTCVLLINVWPMNVKQLGGKTATVYPNPSQGRLNIRSAQQTIERVAFLDYTGRRVYTRQMPETEEVSLDTRGLKSGTYLLKVEYADGTFFFERVSLR